MKKKKKKKKKRKASYFPCGLTSILPANLMI